jgi:uncharacterized RDD family membrane protein YckC
MIAPVTRAPVPDEAALAGQMPAAAPAPRAPAESAPAPPTPADSAPAPPPPAESAAVEVAQAAAHSTTEVATVTGAQRAWPERAAGPAADPTLARPWRRLVAFAIDALILTLVTGALWGRLLASFANRMSNAVDANFRHRPAAHGAYGRVFSHTTGPYLVVLVPTIILAITYYWLLTGYWGTTIGKRAVGTWVVTATGRSRVSLRRSFVRALIFVLGGEVVPLFFVADNLSLIGDQRRQALHDKVAGTLVVRLPPQPDAGAYQPAETVLARRDDPDLRDERAVQ